MTPVFRRTANVRIYRRKPVDDSQFSLWNIPNFKLFRAGFPKSAAAEASPTCQTARKDAHRTSVALHPDLDSASAIGLQ
jgi:hypothetical protein